MYKNNFFYQPASNKIFLHYEKFTFLFFLMFSYVKTVPNTFLAMIIKLHYKLQESV